jgi:hypothetical protein
MQEAVVDRQRLAFDFQPGQEMPVAAQTKRLSHPRARAVRADQEGRMHSRQRHTALILQSTFKGAAIYQVRTGPRRFIGHPAHQAGHVGGLEEIAWRRQVQRTFVGRIEPHAAHLAHQPGGKVELVMGFLDQDAGGAHPRAGFGLGVQHRHFQAAQRGASGTGQPRKTAADNHQVEFLDHAHASAGGSKIACCDGRIVA